MRERHRPGNVILLGNWWYFRAGRGSKAIRIGHKSEIKNKSQARKASFELEREANRVKPKPLSNHTMQDVFTEYRKKEMPTRESTARGYRAWLTNHIEPKWGNVNLHEFAANPLAVRTWLESLDLKSKSKREIRGIIGRCLRAAMLWGWLPNGPNPMELVTIKKPKGEKKNRARVLPLAELKMLIKQLDEPFRTMTYICYFHGLRVSELLGLKWKNVNWLQKQIKLEQAMVRQIEDTVKTPESEAIHPLQDEEIEMLKIWRAKSDFTADDHYIFASPHQAGELPYSYTGFMWKLRQAAKRAGIRAITTHSFRHTFRTRLTANGAEPDEVKTLMRHTTIDMSFQYGEAVSEKIRSAHRSIVLEALSA